MDFDAADPGSTGQVMRFDVVPAAAADPTTPPQFLQLRAIMPLPQETVTRRLKLIEKMGMGYDATGNMVEGPVEALLGTVEAGIKVLKEVIRYLLIILHICVPLVYFPQ